MLSETHTSAAQRDMPIREIIKRYAPRRLRR